MFFLRIIMNEFFLFSNLCVTDEKHASLPQEENRLFAFFGVVFFLTLFLTVVIGGRNDRVGSVNIYAANGTFEDANLGAIMTGLDHNGLFFDADDFADDAADGGNLISDHQLVAHLVDFFFLLLLGTYCNEIKNKEEDDNHADGGNPAGRAAGFRGACEKCDHLFGNLLLR